MFDTLNALVLREVRYQESDRILTVLTADKGKLTLAAHGALSKKSRIAASTQQLTYSEFTLFEKNGRHTVREGLVREDFSGLRMSLEDFALGSYFTECLDVFAAENQPEPELLQLGLNCLYALSNGIGSRDKIKAAFELRLMSLEGYAPHTDSCAVCGRTEIAEPVFDVGGGTIACRGCRKGGIPLSTSVFAALRHILNAPPKKLLSFSVSPEDEKLLGELAETWLLRCSDRRFSTLEYYKKLFS